MSVFEQCREALLNAPTEQAIRSSLVECLSEVMGDLAGLPFEVKEILADKKMAINDAAVTLLHVDMSFHGEPAAVALLREIANVYAAASVRLTQIHMRTG